MRRRFRKMDKRVRLIKLQNKLLRIRIGCLKYALGMTSLRTRATLCDDLGRMSEYNRRTQEFIHSHDTDISSNEG